MSVINQMLRDLDQRGQTPHGDALHQGTQSVLPPSPAPARRAPRRSSRWLLWTALGLGSVLVGAAWYQGSLGFLHTPASIPPTTPAPAAVAAAPPDGPSSAPQGAALPARSDEARKPMPTPAPSTATATVPTAALPVAALKQTPVSAPGRTPAPAPSAAPPARALVVAAPVVPVPAVAPASAPVATASAPPSASTPAPAVPEAAPPVANSGAAARDALAQAQALWNSGNPGAALELLREAVPVALRAPAGTGGNTPDATVLSMVRELARMLMGSGQAGAAHELLLQHESRFRGHADYWATRANVAQRLGQHPDSVQSYMQALQSRPNEQRWLLGLAVSLAAMGQTAAAHDVVEKARAEGPINREIAEYLRQMGVFMK